MKKIQKYCKKIQRETERILYKTFGKKDSIKNYLQMKKELKEEIEKAYSKNIKDITFQELKNNSLTGEYAKYKTLEKILNIYTESACLSLSNMED